jgi:hypothetical protein
MTQATCQGCHFTFDRGLVATPPAIGDNVDLLFLALAATCHAVSLVMFFWSVSYTLLQIKNSILRAFSHFAATCNSLLSKKSSIVPGVFENHDWNGGVSSFWLYTLSYCPSFCMESVLGLIYRCLSSSFGGRNDWLVLTELWNSEHFKFPFLL